MFGEENTAGEEEMTEQEDGFSLIDYVIAYENEQRNEAMMHLFKSKLKDKGLSYQVSDSEKNQKLRFILISAENRDVLTKRAEELRVSVPIEMVKVKDMMKVQTSHTQRGDDEVCVIRTEIEGTFQRKNSYSVRNSDSFKQFVRDWFLPKLVGGHIKFDFQQKFDEVLFVNPRWEGFPDIFTNSSRIRSMIVHDLIKDIELTSDLVKAKSEEVKDENPDKSHPYRGLEWLKKRGYVKKSFVPHSDRDREKFEKKRKEKHNRYPIQSVTSVREYLGEKVAFAFAWRAAWLSWGLTIPAILGLIVFLVDIILYFAKERNRFLMDGASKQGTNSTSIHNYGLLDNEIFPFYAIISLLIQIVGFTIGWPKFKFIYSFKWGMLSYFLEKERSLVMNTTLKELDKSQTKLWYRALSITAGVLIIISMVVFNFVVFLVQQIFKLYLTHKGVGETIAYYSSTVVVSLVNTVFVVLWLNRKFANIAKWLCDKEFHTFPSDYERFLTWKVFFYNFTANNMRLLLMTLAPKITFPFSIPNLNTPGENFHMEFCEEGKCVETICLQLLFFLVCKPLTSLLAYRKDDIVRWCEFKLESLKTCTVRRYHRTRNDSVRDPLSRRLDKEFLLYESDRFAERNQTLMDMNDKVAQYGFTVLFGAVLPLSPLIAAVMEIFTRVQDINRYTKSQRRPIPRRYEGVGCWEEIIDLVNVLAIMTNVWIVVFRSTFVSQYSRDHPVLSISMISGLCFLVYVIRAMSQVHSIPEKVKRFKHAEVGSAEVFLKSLLQP